MIVQGNTDERGGSEYNLALGQKRAEAVRKQLALVGVPESQIEAVSLGKEKPRNQGHDEAAWAENRRADFVYQAGSDVGRTGRRRAAACRALATSGARVGRRAARCCTAGARARRACSTTTRPARPSSTCAAKSDANQRDIASQLELQRRNQADVLNQLDALRQEIARLRGQIESLANDLANEQKRNKDFYVDLDGRLRKVEPQQATVDGQTATVDPNEQRRPTRPRSHQFKTSDFKGSIASFQAFLHALSAVGVRAGGAILDRHRLLRAARLQGGDRRAAAGDAQLPDQPAGGRRAAQRREQPDRHGRQERRPRDARVVDREVPDAPAAATARERLVNLH